VENEFVSNFLFCVSLLFSMSAAVFANDHSLGYTAFHAVTDTRAMPSRRKELSLREQSCRAFHRKRAGTYSIVRSGLEAPKQGPASKAKKPTAMGLRMKKEAVEIHEEQRRFLTDLVRTGNAAPGRSS